MKSINLLLFTLITLGGLAPHRSEANVVSLKPEEIYLADTKKTRFFVQEGLVVGGDHSINDVVVKQVRHARKKGYERIVIDLVGNRNGEPTAIKRPPYYQMEVSPTMSRLVFTLWGNPKLQFDSRQIVQSFKRSDLVKTVQLFPVLDDDRWTFSLDMKRNAAVEIFELSNPVRIIVDLTRAGKRSKK